VVADLERDYGAPESLVFAGFSQGVAMAYRAGVAGRRAGDAILAVAGDVPPELKATERRWPPVRIVVGTREHWYTADRMQADVAFLRAAGADVRATTFEGGHDWTPQVNEAAAELLADVAARPAR
jgi:predicted esterase